MSSPEFPPNPALLLDTRGATETLTLDQLRLRAIWIATLLSHRAGSRCALVVDARPHDYGLARVLTVFLESEGIKTEVFTTIGEARTWLTAADGWRQRGAAGY